MSAVAFNNATSAAPAPVVTESANCTTDAPSTLVVSSTCINATTVVQTVPCHKCEGGFTTTHVPAPASTGGNHTAPSASPSVPQSNGVAMNMASIGSVVAIAGGLLML